MPFPLLTVYIEASCLSKYPLPLSMLVSLSRHDTDCVLILKTV